MDKKGMRNLPHGLFLRLQAMVEADAHLFALNLTEHDGHNFVQVWAFPEDGSSDVIGLTDLQTDRESLERSLGRLLLKILDGTYPNKDGHYAD